MKMKKDGMAKSCVIFQAKLLRDPKSLYAQMETDDKLMEKHHHWRWIQERIRQAWPSWKKAAKWISRTHPYRMTNRTMQQVTVICIYSRTLLYGHLNNTANLLLPSYRDSPKLFL